MAKQNEWLVFFYQNEDYHRTHRFFKKGYKHCGVMGYDPEKKVWIIVETLFSQLLIEVIEETKVDAIFRMIKQKKGHIVKVPVKKKIPRFPVIMGSCIKEHSCVSYVQRLIGMSRFWVFTPYQLYCALKKDGYCEIDI